MADNCIWAEAGDGVWHPECGGAFILNDGTPEENGMKFCCYCGSPLVQQLKTDEDDANG
tara:strand:+ start:475 stop:651 length:177 start_codon:yes stop_codon:yes gene_type:complete